MVSGFYGGNDMTWWRGSAVDNMNASMSLGDAWSTHAKWIEGAIKNEEWKTLMHIIKETSE